MISIGLLIREPPTMRYDAFNEGRPCDDTPLIGGVWLLAALRRVAARRTLAAALRSQVSRAPSENDPHADTGEPTGMGGSSLSPLRTGCTSDIFLGALKADGMNRVDDDDDESSGTTAAMLGAGIGERRVPHIFSEGVRERVYRNTDGSPKGVAYNFSGDGEDMKSLGMMEGKPCFTCGKPIEKGYGGEICEDCVMAAARAMLMNEGIANFRGEPRATE